MGDGAPQESVSPTTPTAPAPKRRWFRFSLRTLVLFVLLLGSMGLLWTKREPWYRTAIHVPGGQSPTAACFAGDDILALTVDRTRIYRLWNLSLGRELWAVNVGDDYVRWCFAPPINTHGVLLTQNAKDRTFSTWDANTGNKLHQFQRKDKEGVWPVLSHDGARVLFSEDTVAHICDVASGQEIATLIGHEKAIWQLAFSPDDRLVATGDASETVILWSVSTGKELLALRGHKDGVSLMGFSGDGRLLATGDGACLLHIWDTSTGALVGQVQDHWCPAPFSPDGRRMAASRGAQASILDRLTGRELFRLEPPKQKWLVPCDFSPDGERLLTVVGSEATSTLDVWTRNRDEDASVVIVPEFWLTLIFGLAFSWSVWRDRKTL